MRYDIEEDTGKTPPTLVLASELYRLANTEDDQDVKDRAAMLDQLISVFMAERFDIERAVRHALLVMLDTVVASRFENPETKSVSHRIRFNFRDESWVLTNDLGSQEEAFEVANDFEECLLASGQPSIKTATVH